MMGNISFSGYIHVFKKEKDLIMKVLTDSITNNIGY